MSSKRRLIPLPLVLDFIVISLLWCSTFAAVPDSKTSPPLPNFLIFLADDLGTGDIGCFGNDTLRTPNVDRIAREGARLSHDLATAAICTPSRAAFLTGRYPIRMGMVPHDLFRVFLSLSTSAGLPSKEVTFGELAKARNYSTAYIGKWHQGLNCETNDDYCHHPLRQGFDYFYGLPLTNLRDFAGDPNDTVVLGRFPHFNRIIAAIFAGTLILVVGLVKLGLVGSRRALLLLIALLILPAIVYVFCNSFHRLNGVIMRDFEIVEQPINLTRSGGFTRRLVGEATRFVRQRTNDRQPFLLVVAWLQVHTVLHASERFRGRSRHGAYGDEVEEMDWSVGEVMATLREGGLENDTLVYFSSDHGAHLEEIHDGQRHGGHNGIYSGGKGQGGMDGGIRVPTVLSWPGRIQPGLVVETPTSHMDLFATIRAILDPQSPSRDGGQPQLDGVDLMPFLSGKKERQAELATSIPHEFLFHYCCDQIHAARHTTLTPEGRPVVWKARFATPNWLPGTQQCGFLCGCYGSSITLHDPPLLFNLNSDPSELHPLNLNADRRYREILEKIRVDVEKHKESVETVPSQFAPLKRIPKPWLQPCCNAPYCSCMEEL